MVTSAEKSHVSDVAVGSGVPRWYLLGTANTVD